MTAAHPEPVLRRAWPFFPPVLVAAYVLNLWVESGVSIYAVGRSLIVGVAVALVLMLILTRATRHAALAAVLTTILLGFLMSRGLAGAAAFLVMVLAAWAITVLIGRMRQRVVTWNGVTRALNAVSILLLTVVLASGIPRGAFRALFSTDLAQGASRLPSAAGERGSSPNMLVLLLDGYPREDFLRDVFEFENGAFLDSLRDRGFDVADRSQSNYPYTQATLTSFFHMRPLLEIRALEGVAAQTEDPHPRLREVANNNPAFDLLRQHGYLVVASSPGYEHAALRAADVFLDDGSLNEPERHLIRGTPIQAIAEALSPGVFLDQHRRRTLASFAFAEDVSRAMGNERMFALIHVPSPHLPVSVSRDGGLAEFSPDEPLFRTRPLDRATRNAYVGQLAYLNQRTLEVVDVAIGTAAQTGPLVILILSDHSSEPPARSGEPWTASHHANMTALWTTPDIAIDLPEDVTPLNLLPTIFDAAMGMDFPRWPDMRYPWVGVENEGAGP